MSLNCEKCSEYESQLREALDELGSAREIIEILENITPVGNYLNNCKY
jgi:hypothetical protein